MNLSNTSRRFLGVVVALPALISGVAALARGGDAPSASQGHTFNILDYGAKGDGTALETAAINRAIEACATHGGGQVLLPPGRYLSGTIHLRSQVTLWLAAGARLVGTTNLALYDRLPIPASLPEARFGAGKWARALIVSDGIEDAAIAGPGVIDGNKVFDPTGEEHMRGPHTIAFTGCRRFSIRDVSIVDSANYAVYFQVSDDVEVRNVSITGGWDGVHFRGRKAAGVITWILSAAGFTPATTPSPGDIGTLWSSAIVW